MKLEIILNNTPLDYELNDMLGTPASDYLVLYADGIKVDFWGTPIDSEVERQEMDQCIKMLNDPKDDFWFRCYKARPAGWHRVLGDDLDPICTPPKFSYAISRTCAGYSSHFHAAVHLLEKFEQNISKWSISRKRDGTARVEIFDVGGKAHRATGQTPAEAISLAARDFLKSNKEQTH